jgi:hypothetical protein
MVVSIDSKDGVQLYHELKELSAKAKMEARQWVSNSPQRGLKSVFNFKCIVT